MFLGNEEKYHLNTLLKTGLFERAEMLEYKKTNELAKTLIEKADALTQEEYSKVVMEIMKDYGLYFELTSETSVADLLSYLANSVYESGYHPKDQTVTFLGKSFKDIKIKPYQVVKFIKTQKLNQLLTEERGLYLQEVKIREGASGFYLLKYGVKFDKNETEFLKFVKGKIFS